ncbi:hypothetical protein AAC691_11465 [Nguyenibacter vanlangensis]|uniref:Uncharacterized protein n=1 Tax=Nguyenibacter vanlangensis TaxID=1216886 RepID=A0ABZ3D040_9PROT
MMDRRTAFRAVLPMAALSLLSACSGIGKFASDTISFPGSFPGANPNAPHGAAENLRRVRGETVAAAPIVPEPGNIWPSASEILSGAGGPAMAGPAVQAELQPGESLSLGEDAEIRNGVQIATNPVPRTKTPDFSDAGHAPAAGRAVIIPNGDGTSTVISPTGAVRTIKDKIYQ